MNIFNIPRLPQKDSNRDSRKRILEESSKDFIYDDSAIQGVPISLKVPNVAKAGLGWSMTLVGEAYRNRRNWEDIDETQQYVFELPLPHKSTIEIATILAKQDLVGFQDYTSPERGVCINVKRPESFQTYYDLFHKYDIPEISLDESDDSFADYFVQGLNPVMIQSISTLKDNYNLSNDEVANHLLFEGDDLDSLLEDRRLFVVDYSALEGLESGHHPDQKKYIYSPIVYLAVDKNTESLEVLGVQTGQSNDYPIITNRDQKWDWFVAKMIARSADINYHEGITHLGLTHLLIDPVAVSTFKNLSKNHPLYVLLAPHFEGTLPINDLAVRRLISKGGIVEQLLAPNLDSLFDTISTARNSFSFRGNFLPKTFEARGVTGKSTLKNYAYRDDSLLIWNSIRTWVKSYIELYYKNEKDIQEDYELSNWVRDISSSEGGRVKDFTPKEGIQTFKVLEETLTMIIFTASAQHAAVNFPQEYASNMIYQPLAGYSPAPKTKGLSEQDVLDFLPPIDLAIKQLHILKLLGSSYYSVLGEYSLGTFNDKRVVPRLWNFQERLEKIEGKINNRNKTRRNEYKHLLPSKIPQSINI